MSDIIANIPAFGLTGGIASGKSTVALCFESLGARVIDADSVGHELLMPGGPTYRQITSTFGLEIMSPAGEIDRKRLAAIVFPDPQKLRALNAILHPLILLRILEMSMENHKREPTGVTIVEAALIYEAGIEKNFQQVIATWCRPEQQLQRLLAKSGLPQAEAQARIASQIPLDQKRRQADYVIDCSTTSESTQAQVRELYPKLRKVVAEPKTG